jgi:malate dehydrogenase
MSTVAILGAGRLGGALAHRLAVRAAVRQIAFVDAAPDVAAGKALDIQQSGPIDRTDVRLTASSDVLSAVGASVIVVADPHGREDWEGESGLALIARLVKAGTTAPFVFIGARQIPLMELVARELGVAPNRLVATAGGAIVGAVRALIGLEVGGSGADVEALVCGRPPALVVVWSSATIGGALAADRIAPHRQLAIGRAARGFWPPGPEATASATAGLIEALVDGSRQTHQAAAILEGEFESRGVAAQLPLLVEAGRIHTRIVPALTAQERLDLTKSL